MSKKILLAYLILIVMVLGCSKEPTGKAIAAEPDIYEGSAPVQEAVNETNQIEQPGQKIQIKTGEEYYKDIINDNNNEAINDEKPKEKVEEFQFSPESIVSMQNNISLSLDNIKHELKSEYWGKIVEITATVLNRGHGAFKPKLMVLLYDEKDFKEEWLKSKAEIEFDEKLGAGSHITRQAIVSIAFDEIALTKHFKLILVDAADPGNKPVAVVEKEFNPIIG